VRIKCELEQVVQLRTKGKAVFSFDKQYAGHFTNFTDKPLTIEILVDEQEQIKRLAMISSEQRKKIYALFNDISNYTGDTPDNVKEMLKDFYCYERGIESFSLSDCDKQLASDFIEWAVDWSFRNGVPLKEQPKDYFDNSERYIAVCNENRVCCVCGKPGEIHHIDTIGMGRDRRKVDDSDYRKICLCRAHHSEAHQIGWDTFADKYHLGGKA